MRAEARLALALGLALAPLPLAAQQSVIPCYQSTVNSAGIVGCIPVSVANPLPTTGGGGGGGSNVTVVGPLGQTTKAGSLPVVVASDQGQLAIAGATNVTATDCSGTIAAGGTAQNAFTAQAALHGFTIVNIDPTGEPIWFSMTGTAAASGTSSYPLSAPTATSFANIASFTAPPGLGLNHALSVIAATTGHKFSCTWW